MSGSFDFGTAFEPERPRASIPQPPPQPVRPSPRPASPIEPERRGQGLSWASMATAVVGAVAVGLGLYFLLDSIRFRVGGFDDIDDWGNLVAIGLCLVVLSCAGAIVSLVRSRPRVVATIALLAALVLPIIVAIWGAKVGVGSLLEHVSDDLGKTGAEAILAIEQTLEANGFKVGPIVKSLLKFLASP